MRALERARHRIEIGGGGVFVIARAALGAQHQQRRVKARLDLFEQFGLEIGKAGKAELDDETNDGRIADSGALGEAGRGAEARQGIIAQQDLNNPGLRWRQRQPRPDQRVSQSQWSGSLQAPMMQD